MVGAWRYSICVLAISLMTVSSAGAFGGRFFRPMSASQYYECVPVGPTVMPVPDARPGYAKPTPAPPSGTPEPPLQKGKVSDELRKPVIVASHAPGSGGKSPMLDRARVGFWNLSGRDVTLMIDGKSLPLAKNAAVTLDLERQFTWHLAGQAQQHVERLPDGLAVHEVLIRE